MVFEEDGRRRTEDGRKKGRKGEGETERRRDEATRRRQNETDTQPSTLKLNLKPAHIVSLVLIICNPKT